MEVMYRGFVGTVVYDMDEDLYRISGGAGGRSLVEIESPAYKGVAVLATVFKEFKISVDMLLDKDDGDTIPEGGDGDGD